jgi:hypothetical protein
MGAGPHGVHGQSVQPSVDEEKQEESERVPIQRLSMVAPPVRGRVSSSCPAA